MGKRADGPHRWVKPLALGALAAAAALGLVVVLVGPRRAGETLAHLGRVLQTRAAQAAYFYRPPTDATAPSTVAQNEHVVFLTQGDEAYRDQLRAAGFSGLILQYLMANQIDANFGPGQPCDPNYVPYTNNFANQKGDPCTFPESSFLHNG